MFSDAQEVFMLFYAVLYGTTLGSMSGFFPFQWGQLFLNKRFRNRLLLSIIFLNFGPIIYFLSVIYMLKGKTLCLSSWSQIIFSFLVIFSALGVFAFYRIYHIFFCLDRNRNIFWLNDNCRNDDNCLVGNDCWMRIKRKRNLHCDYFGHTFAVIFYFIPFIILLINTKTIYDIIYITIISSLLLLIFLILHSILGRYHTTIKDDC